MGCEATAEAEAPGAKSLDDDGGGKATAPTVGAVRWGYMLLLLFLMAITDGACLFLRSIGTTMIVFFEMLFRSL